MITTCQKETAAFLYNQYDHFGEQGLGIKKEKLFQNKYCKLALSPILPPLFLREGGLKNKQTKK